MYQDVRRLRRDLHDRVGPLLAAVTMRTEVARATIIDDPATARQMLDELRTDACNALAEVRRLARPGPAAAPEDHCLIAALPYQAGRFCQASGGGLEVTVAVAPAVASAPAPVQTTLYRIAIEALTNTARHAKARTCTIRVWSDSDGYYLEVIDDGTGLPRRRGTGVGLRSMRDRAAELGGMCVVENVVPHGTRIYTMVPAAPLAKLAAEAPGALG